MTLLGLLLAIAAAGALGLALLAVPGRFNLELIGVSIAASLLGGLFLALDHRRVRARGVSAPARPVPAPWWRPPAPTSPGADEPPWSVAPSPRSAPPAGGDSVRVAWALADEPAATPALRDDLLDHFGSWRALSAASVEELEEAPGVDYALARRLRAALDR